SNRWSGTNGNQATGNYSGSLLDDRWALKDEGGNQNRGKAFFALADMLSSPAVVGGLENAGAYTTATGNNVTYFRLPVTVTAQSQNFRNNEWFQDTDYTNSLNADSEPGDQNIYTAAYNLQGYSLGDKAVFYGGQQEFQNPLPQSLDHDPHVPDYGFNFGPKTFMYKPTTDDFDERWFAMADLGIAGVDNSFAYVKVTPGIQTLSAGSQTIFTAHPYNANGVRLTGATCSWSLSGGAFGIISNLEAHPNNTVTATANPNLDVYRKIGRGLKADCNLEGQTLSGFADIAVYPSGTAKPEPVLSRAETNTYSAIVVPGAKRVFRATAYDQYYANFPQAVEYQWTLNYSNIGTIGSDSNAQLEFTATKEKQFAGNYPDAITLRITYLDPNLGEVTY